MSKMVKYWEINTTIGFAIPENPRIPKISKFYRLVLHLGKDVNICLIWQDIEKRTSPSDSPWSKTPDEKFSAHSVVFLAFSKLSLGLGLGLGLVIFDHWTRDQRSLSLSLSLSLNRILKRLRIHGNGLKIFHWGFSGALNPNLKSVFRYLVI